VGQKFNGTHQLMVYARDISPVRENIDITKRSTETLMLLKRLT
jgi:hypothetical protein